MSLKIFLFCVSVVTAGLVGMGISTYLVPTHSLPIFQSVATTIPFQDSPNLPGRSTRKPDYSSEQEKSEGHGKSRGGRPAPLRNDKVSKQEKNSGESALVGSHSFFVHAQFVGANQDLKCSSCHQTAGSGFANQGMVRMHADQAGSSAKTGPSNKPDEQAAFLGIHASDLTQTLRSHLKMQDGAGALVENVVPESPAHHCGLEKNDVIVSVNDRNVMGHDDLTSIIRAFQPGTKIRLRFVRAGEGDSLDLVLGKQIRSQTHAEFRISGCKAPITSRTNCGSCHSTE